MGRDFDRAENYLSLVGLVIVILGGIAISSVTRVFIAQKIRSIAVLKCLGARSNQIMVVYILQVLALGLAGSLLGVLLARTTIAAIPLALGGSTSILAEADYGLSWSAAVQGVDRRAAGVAAVLRRAADAGPPRQALAPAARRVDQARARLGEDGGDGARRAGADRRRRLAGRLAARRGGGVLRLCRAGLRAAGGRPDADRRDRAARQVAVVSASPCGAASVAPGQPDAHDPVRGRSRRVLRRRRPVAAGEPAGGVFDSDLGRRARHVSARHPARAGRRRPRVPRRSGKRGGQLAAACRCCGPGSSASAGARPTWTVSTTFAPEARWHASTPSPTATTSKRTSALPTAHSGPAPSPDPEVSVELGIHERFAINVGDLMRFDILGRTIAARVSSVREVDWRDARSGGFMFVFRPGALDEAPQTFIAPLKGPADAAARGRFQPELVGAVPQRVGDRLSRDSRDRARHHVEGDAGDDGRRRPGAVQRRADSDRRGGDDEVSARLRGGGVQDARRQHAHHREDAAVRIRHARVAGRAWSARSARSR